MLPPIRGRAVFHFEFGEHIGSGTESPARVPLPVFCLCNQSFCLPYFTFFTGKRLPIFTCKSPLHELVFLLSLDMNEMHQ